MATKQRRPSDESIISLSFNPNQKAVAAPGGEEVPHINGYLLKKSSNGEWQRRYFETNGSFLTYYKSQKMTKLLAALSLPQVGNITINGEIEDNQGKGVIIQLELKDREYTLRALTQKEAQKWVKVLSQLRDTGGGAAGGGSAVDESPKAALNKSDGSGRSASSVPNSAKQMGSPKQKSGCCCIM